MNPERRILIVDDSTAIHEDIRRILTPLSRASSTSRASLEEELFGKALHAVNTVNALEYDIDDAYQGLEAIEKITTALAAVKPYQMLFLDIRMPPGIDGVETARRVWEKAPATQIVIISAYSDYSWDQILVELGASDKLLFLRKPFDAVAIKQTALSLTAKWHLDRHNHELINELETRVAERTRQLDTALKTQQNFIDGIEDELDFARRVQTHLLPKVLPTLEHCTMTARYLPTGKVGGDYYQCIKLNEHLLSVVIFDVSGHGLAASLITALGKASFDRYCATLYDPAEILTLVNKEMFESTLDEMFVTAYCMVLDTKNNTLAWASAGHTPQLLFHAAEGTVERMSGTGLFLGIDAESKYQTKKSIISSGDTIILFTDGLTEACNSNNQPWGRDRLDASVKRLSAGSVDALADGILDDTAEFTQNHLYVDDVCLFVIRRN